MMWRVVLDGDESSGVVDFARKDLVSLHTSLAPELQADRKSVRTRFIE